MRDQLRAELRMKNEERELKNLVKTYKTPDMTGEQRERLDLALKAELKKTRLVPKESMVRRILRLTQFISPSVWLLQAVFLALAFLIARGQQTIYLWNLSVMIPFLGVIAVPEMAKSFSSGMWELEQSCFFNLRRLIAAKMAVFGFVDGIVVIFLMAAAGSRGAGPAGVVLAVLVPFCLSNTVYLVLFRLLKRRCTGYVLTAAGIAMVVGMLLLIRYLPALTDEAAGRLACGMGIGGVVILAASGYEVLKQIDREEITIWNFE